MHDPTEYPLASRCFVWFVDEVIPTTSSIFSPIFDIDRGMGISSTVAAATGASAAGNPDHLLRTIPIGLRWMAHFHNAGAAAVSFELFGSCAEDVNPIVLDQVSGPTAIASGGGLAEIGFNGFPFIQASIVNADAVDTAAVCGAFRIFPIFV